MKHGMLRLLLVVSLGLNIGKTTFSFRAKRKGVSKYNIDQLITNIL